MNINIVAGSSIKTHDVHGLVTCKFDGVAIQLNVVQAAPLRSYNLPRIRALNSIERVMMNTPVYHRVIPIRYTIIPFDEVVMIYFCIVNCQLYAVPCTACPGIHIDCIVMNPDGLNTGRGCRVTIDQGDRIIHIAVINFVAN